MVEFKNNLKDMMTDMESADELYRPTNFWSTGLPKILTDIEKFGVEQFRTHKSAAFFYVPRYASNTLQKYGNLITPILPFLPKRKQIRLQKRLTRSDRARLDYRIFCASSISGGLPINQISESSIGGGERFSFDGRQYSRSMLNYLRALNLLKREVDTTNLKSILEIGGGYGTLGEILLKASPNSFYINVDIPPVAAVATYYLQNVFGSHNVLTYSESRKLDIINLSKLKRKYKAVILCPWQLPLVKGETDLFANFMSFQEMEPKIVKNYIKLVQPLVKNHILLRNTAIGKKIALKKGEIGVIKQVKSDFIQKEFSDFIILARDSFVYGEENDTGSYQSEVTLLKRN